MFLRAAKTAVSRQSALEKEDEEDDEDEDEDEDEDDEDELEDDKRPKRAARSVSGASAS